MKTNVYLWQYLAEISLEYEMFPKKICRQNQKTFYVT